jgi:hypothetical protein
MGPGDIVKVSGEPDILYWYVGSSGLDAFVVPLRILDNNRCVRLSSDKGRYVRASDLFQDLTTAAAEVTSEEAAIEE